MVRALGTPVVNCAVTRKCATASRAPADAASGLETVLFLAKGAKVVLARNLWQDLGGVCQRHSRGSRRDNVCRGGAGTGATLRQKIKVNLQNTGTCSWSGTPRDRRQKQRLNSRTRPGSSSPNWRSTTTTPKWLGPSAPQSLNVRPPVTTRQQGAHRRTPPVVWRR